MYSFRVVKTDVKMIYTNAIYVNTKHKTLIESGYVRVNDDFLLGILPLDSLAQNEVALSSPMRTLLAVMIGDTVKIEPEQNKPDTIESIKMDVNVVGNLQMKIDAVELVDKIKIELNAYPINFGQTLIFEFKEATLKLGVAELSLKNNNQMNVLQGVLDNSTEIFLISSSSKIQMTNAQVDATMLKPNFSFEKLEIGGLKKEFEQMFRRAFVQRLFDPETIKNLGIPHVKGIMLHGPPGTGKTLIARKLGTLLGANAPKVVNGPEILNKYVGQSEENIRNLFADAEAEYKTKGEHSSLHIIIFDEIDAICKKRGSDNSGVGDKVVNQLLSKIDGVEALNNILVIGMTNRLDLIDDALLRPGRFEIHLEISLPDEKARLEIFQIHTKKMTGNNFLDEDVDFVKLSALTKNYTGAEIAAVVRAACSFALERNITEKEENTEKGLLEADNSKIKIGNEDLLKGLSEIKPAFGVDLDEFNTFGKIIYETDQFDKILLEARGCLQKLRRTDLFKTSSMLLYGQPGTGKTTLTIQAALTSQFSFIKFITPKDLVGLSEFEKVAFIKEKFNDAYKSEEAIIVLDEIESLIEYVQIGPRFSNNVLQALKIFIKNESNNLNCKVFIFGTTSLPDVMVDCGIVDSFNECCEVKKCTKEDYDQLCKQNELFKQVDFTEEITIKRLLNLLPEKK